LSYSELIKDFEKLRNQQKAKVLSGFFKTGKGEYGEGDVFLGIVVPTQRKLAKKYAGLALGDLQHLLDSKIHEHRLTALFILIGRYKKSAENERERIVKFYLRNARKINNWDLVDLSAPNILGDYLLDKDKAVLYKLASSKNLWERRIAMLAAFRFIRENKFDDALRIAETLLKDKHDLIHKSAGWMLREIGKRDLPSEERFLKKHHKVMPRTMLRYAIERLPESKRKIYLAS